MGTHDCPASVVCNKVPPEPAATPSVLEKKRTQVRRAGDSALNCQVTPPSGLWTILPLPPTAHAFAASTNATSSKFSTVPLGRDCQVSPPSVVLKMRPPSPTAMPLEMP